MTVNEATAFLHCHRVTLLRLIRRGQLLLLKTGSTWSFQRAQVNALSNRNIAVYPHLAILRRSK
jgi:excisionase family DNA binding protein